MFADQGRRIVDVFEGKILVVFVFQAQSPRPRCQGGRQIQGAAQTAVERKEALERHIALSVLALDIGIDSGEAEASQHRRESPAGIEGRARFLPPAGWVADGANTNVEMRVRLELERAGVERVRPTVNPLQSGRQGTVDRRAAQQQHFGPLGAVAHLNAIEVAHDLVAATATPLLRNDAGQFKGVEEQAAADDGVEIANSGFKATPAIDSGALEKLAVVAAGGASAEGLAANSELEIGDCIVETELMVDRPQIAGLRAGQIADLGFGQGRKPQFGLERGCQQQYKCKN